MSRRRSSFQMEVAQRRNWRVTDLEWELQELGFTYERTRGSHVTYLHPDGEPFRFVVPKRGQVDAEAVRRLQNVKRRRQARSNGEVIADQETDQLVLLRERQIPGMAVTHNVLENLDRMVACSRCKRSYRLRTYPKTLVGRSSVCSACTASEQRLALRQEQLARDKEKAQRQLPTPRWAVERTAPRVTLPDIANEPIEVPMPVVVDSNDEDRLVACADCQRSYPLREFPKHKFKGHMRYCRDCMTRRRNEGLAKKGRGPDTKPLPRFVAAAATDQQVAKRPVGRPPKNGYTPWPPVQKMTMEAATVETGPTALPEVPSHKAYAHWPPAPAVAAPAMDVAPAAPAPLDSRNGSAAGDAAPVAPVAPETPRSPEVQHTNWTFAEWTQLFRSPSIFLAGRLAFFREGESVRVLALDGDASWAGDVALPYTFLTRLLEELGWQSGGQLHGMVYGQAH